MNADHCKTAYLKALEDHRQAAENYFALMSNLGVPKKLEKHYAEIVNKARKHMNVLYDECIRLNIEVPRPSLYP